MFTLHLTHQGFPGFQAHPQTGSRLHEVCSRLRPPGPDSVDLGHQPFPASLSTGQAPGPHCFGRGGKDRMQHLGLGRVEEVCEGLATLLRPTALGHRAWLCGQVVGKLCNG